MVELTPEILAQLERDAASFGGYFNVRIDDEFDSLDYGHDATFEAAMRLRDEVGRLRRFVGECLTILEAMP